ncbi:putative superfamily III holin-X [Novosphingobium sp. PhB55]|uniref:phage holin family protein n=1 Tax=Novosphingobium sp. PhB55 TaxID=2485106 RepID=UPI0010661CCA|nr:phage holin family protein [Novosphingobium sp. PhB55]TDW68569.1 putative superfamily III holin-X [Novosphingobium sp. PhB55]
MLDTQANLAPPLQEGEDLSLIEDVRLLLGEARTFAQAEVTYQKTRAAYLGAETKSIAVLGVGAAIFVFFALMALVLGAVIAVGTLIGPWLAMVAVPMAILLVALFMGLSARGRVKRMMAILKEKEGSE